MTIFQTRIKNRIFDTKLVVPGVEFTPQRLEWKAQGGPSLATIKVTGAVNQLWELVELLRCPIEISTKEKDPLWWGYIESVNLNLGAMQISATIESMSNRVQVVYSQVNTAGTVGEYASTSWIQDDLSVAEYGTKELKYSLSQGTVEQANAQAATILNRLKWGTVKHQFGTSGQISATLNCAGWWKTLDWKYYGNSAGKESYEETGNGLQAMGDSSTRAKLAQSFSVSSGTTWLANVVKLRVKREGTPTDNLIVSICSDSSGVPGTVLANVSVAGSSLDENLNWIELTLSSRISLTPVATYWIVVERSGAVSSANYYKVDANEDLGYSGGVFRIYNGATWAARVPNADMLFVVSGVIETTAQLSTILSTSGQFFTGIDLEIVSGVYSSPWRDGNQKASICVDELLNSGTTNQRRILATVDYNRRVRIYEEPVSGSNDYLISANGSVSNWLNLLLRNWEIPAGIWAKLKDVIPGSVNTTKLADPNRVFVESVQYNAEQDRITLQERDMQRITDITAG